MWYSSHQVSNSLLYDFERFQKDFQSLFNTAFPRQGIRMATHAFPQISMAETKDEVCVYVFAAGLSSKDFDLTIQANLLTITVNRQKSEPEKYHHHRTERFVGEFTRMVSLPESIDANQVRAKYENGVLQIVIDKKSELKPRKIEIKAN